MTRDTFLIITQLMEKAPDYATGFARGLDVAVASYHEDDDFETSIRAFEEIISVLREVTPHD